MLPPSSEIVVPAARIKERVAELAAAIAADLQGLTPHLICVLKGAFIFTADLVRAFSGPVTLDFLAVASYGDGGASTGEVMLLKDLDESIRGRHVIVVEDIVDTGLTCAYLRRTLLAREPASLRVAALLSKPSRRRVQVPIEYLAFEIPDRFVIGYGLDRGQLGRNLPDIVALSA